MEVILAITLLMSLTSLLVALFFVASMARRESFEARTKKRVDELQRKLEHQGWRIDVQHTNAMTDFKSLCELDHQVVTHADRIEKLEAAGKKKPRTKAGQVGGK